MSENLKKLNSVDIHMRKLKYTLLMWLLLEFYESLEQKSAHIKKLAISRKSSWKLAKMITSWDYYFHQGSWQLDKNCGFFYQRPIIDLGPSFCSKLEVWGNFSKELYKGFFYRAQKEVILQQIYQNPCEFWYHNPVISNNIKSFAIKLYSACWNWFFSASTLKPW